MVVRRGWEVLVSGFTLSGMRRLSPEDLMYSLVTTVKYCAECLKLAERS